MKKFVSITICSIWNRQIAWTHSWKGLIEADSDYERFLLAQQKCKDDFPDFAHFGHYETAVLFYKEFNNN